jgi:hypothetical protein
MKVKHSFSDEFFYTLLCVVSGGTLWALRLLVSVAIRKALED